VKLTDKTICMPVAHEFEDVELLYPLLRLSEEGARIVLGTYHASFHARPYLKDKPITGRLGYPVPPVPMVEGRRFTLADMLSLSPEDFDAVVKVHMYGTFNTMQHASAYWRNESKEGRQPSASIVNTVSSAGLQGQASQINYGAAKGNQKEA
jgi:hypothetical protein